MVTSQQAEQTKITRRRALGAISAGAAGCLGVFFTIKSNGSNEQPVAQVSCDWVHENLQEFVDNKIADRYQAGLISRHLFVCADCQTAYQGMIDGNDFLCTGG